MAARVAAMVSNQLCLVLLLAVCAGFLPECGPSEAQPGWDLHHAEWSGWFFELYRGVHLHQCHAAQRVPTRHPLRTAHACVLRCVGLEPGADGCCSGELTARIQQVRAARNNHCQSDTQS